MAYPSSVISFSIKVDNDVIEPAHVNLMQTEIEAIDSGLLNGFAHVLQPSTHATRDLGLTGTRWRDLFLSRNADIDGTLDVAGAASLGQLTLPLASSWTPTDSSGAGLTLATAVGRYAKIGPLIVATAEILFPATANGSGVSIGGLPVNATASVYGSAIVSYTDVGFGIFCLITAGNNSAAFQVISTGAALTNAQMSGKILRFTAVYLGAS